MYLYGVTFLRGRFSLETRRNVKYKKSETFKNPLLISILNDKQKYFKNLCKKICQYKNNL